MNKQLLKAFLSVVVILFGASYVAAHCEIPCGIYDDALRVKLMAEHITTMEKSMQQVVSLATQQPTNYNQLVRWVTNKEDHANAFQHIVTQYFMTQRIKPDSKDYIKKITVLHKMLVVAMQCKQTTDEAHIAMLRSLLKEFSDLYFVSEHK